MKYNQLISAGAIARRVSILGKAINYMYATQPGVLQVIPVMDGAMFFAADLLRWVTVPVVITPVTCKSYQGTQAGDLEVRGLPNLTAVRVLFVEDILDTGATLRYLFKQAFLHGATSAHACVLLDKHKKEANDLRQCGFVPECLSGFFMPDSFVIGYGLDLDGQYRNLSYIAEVVSETLPL